MTYGPHDPGLLPHEAWCPCGVVIDLRSHPNGWCTECTTRYIQQLQFEMDPYLLEGLTTGDLPLEITDTPAPDDTWRKYGRPGRQV